MRQYAVGYNSKEKLSLSGISADEWNALPNRLGKARPATFVEYEIFQRLPLWLLNRLRIKRWMLLPEKSGANE